MKDFITVEIGVDDEDFFIISVDEFAKSDKNPLLISCEKQETLKKTAKVLIKKLKENISKYKEYLYNIDTGKFYKIDRRIVKKKTQEAIYLYNGERDFSSFYPVTNLYNYSDNVIKFDTIDNNKLIELETDILEELEDYITKETVEISKEEYNKIKHLIKGL